MNNFRILSILAFITLALSALGAAPPTVPIGNMGDLRLYLADSAAKFRAGAYSASQVKHEDRETYFEGVIEGAGIYGITNSIAQQTRFTIPFANPEDYSTFWVDVYDEKNELIFTGQVSQFPSRVGGDRYSFGNASPQLYMRSKIKLRGFKGAYSARVMVTDPAEDGRTSRSFYLEVDEDEGTIEFPKALVGKGYMEVSFDDGTSVLYGPDGKLSNKKLGKGVITPAVANSFVFVNSTNLVITNIQSWDGQGVNPSIQLRLDSEQVILIGGQTREGAWARGLMFRKAGRAHRDDVLQPISFEKGDGVTEGSYLLRFPAGDWAMYLTWDPEQFREREEDYEPDDDNIGKGNVPDGTTIDAAAIQ